MDNGQRASSRVGNLIDRESANYFVNAHQSQPLKQETILLMPTSRNNQNCIILRSDRDLWTYR